MAKEKRFPRKLYVCYEKESDFYVAEEKTDAFIEDCTIGLYESQGDKSALDKT